jgi:hypothetical protein
MRHTRRQFLQTTSAAALGLGTLSEFAARASERAGSEQPKPPTGVQASVQPQSAANLQVPRMKFAGTEISRMVLGVNPLYGYAHYNLTYSSMMAEWYTQDKVCEVMHYAGSVGINAFNYVTTARSAQDFTRFQAEGGKMHLIAQVAARDDVAQLVRDLKPLAVHRQGEVVDIAFREGKMGSVRDWCKQVRDLGVAVGVGTHKPEVIELVEEQGWDVDFYAGCAYNRTRTVEEWKQLLGGQTLEMPKEIYLQSDPPRMYGVMRKTTKPCFAFKILAAGRLADAEIKGAFKTAFDSIKPIDGIFVGMFPKRKDEIRENAETVHNILAGT